jgi:hypothetical protein
MTSPSTNPFAIPPTEPATPASTTLPTPEEIADYVVYALDVHEKQLRELRPDPDELKRLTLESLRVVGSFRWAQEGKGLEDKTRGSNASCVRYGAWYCYGFSLLPGGRGTTI